MSRTVGPESPITWKMLALVIGIVATVIPVAVAWAVATARVEGKLDREEYLRDKATLADQIAELRSDVRVIRIATCAKSPEFCK